MATLTTQYEALTGRRRRRKEGPLTAAQALFLPEIYRRRAQDEQTEREFALEEERMALAERELEEEKKQARLGNLISGTQVPISGYFAYEKLKGLKDIPGLTTPTAPSPTPPLPVTSTGLSAPSLAAPSLKAGIPATYPAFAGTAEAGAATAGLSKGLLAGVGQAATLAVPAAVALGGATAIYKGLQGRGRSRKRRQFRELRRRYGQQFAGLSPEQAREMATQYVGGEGPLVEAGGAGIEALYGTHPEAHRIVREDIGRKEVERHREIRKSALAQAIGR